MMDSTFINKKAPVKTRRQSFSMALRHALQGIQQFFLRDRNGKIHLTVAVITIAFGCLLQLTAADWVAIFFCIGAVISLEMMNAAIEKCCDIIHPHYSPVIKYIKDVSAAAVLVFSIISLAVGCIIFIPAIIEKI